MAFTVVNHSHVSQTMESALAEQGISHEACFITPTIFNNVLWNAVVDRGDVFLLAQYSVFDEVPCDTPQTQNRKFHPVSKGHDLLHNLDTDETLNVLRWFSAGFFNAVQREDGTLQLNDLRFGTFSGQATSPH